MPVSRVPTSNGIISGLSIWLAAAVWLGASGIYFHASPFQVAATVWGLVGTVLVMSRWNPVVRLFAATVDIRALVAVHVVRFVGIVFIVLFSRGRFPFAFAVPAGIGDVAVAIGALAVLGWCMPVNTPLRRRVILSWNTLGLVDMVLVVFTALREGLRDSVAMAPLREFPLSLLPTFLVPLIIAAHVVIFKRIREPRFAIVE